MALITRKFSDYQIIYYGKNSPIEALIEFHASTYEGGNSSYIKFYKTEMHVPADSLNGDVITVNYPISRFRDVLALMLSAFKEDFPVTLNFDDETLTGDLMVTNYTVASG